jgi:hypothetical protein
MPNYYVYLTKSQLYRLEVTANSKEEAKALVYEDPKRFTSKKMDDSWVVDPYIETVEQQVDRNKHGRFPDMGS